jgi:hypothetical protein
MAVIKNSQMVLKLEGKFAARNGISCDIVLRIWGGNLGISFLKFTVAWVKRYVNEADADDSNMGNVS